ncbi:Golgi to ER traffic protein 4 homolog isoform X4 [Bombyx mandarina]|uniref:Golgi to ER traffic protein 4 homolog isoform X4 n=1 Tax=Bombyx mandarina TaxID=7092 RepID=A0A6J2KPB4_BOMMA|nr:Golgi to ER traffic protein 4 homolog isoform X4 [Bombyx mandarina]
MKHIKCTELFISDFIFYSRYLTQKKYPELLTLLYKGSTLLLERDQQGSGADLAILFVEVLTKSETKPNEEWVSKLAKLFELISSSVPERETFLTNSIKWSMDNNKKGDPLLHKKIAEVFWKEKKYTAAHRHFLHSSDGSAYANMLIELHTTKGLKSEIDLFIAQAVLQILCLRNVRMATETFLRYTETHPKIKNSKGPPYIFPLLNFLWFLLRAVEQRHVRQFMVLKNWYAISIKRDPNYSIFLDNIGRIWFGIEIPSENRNPNSMFGGLIKSIIGDIDSSDDDGESKTSATAPDLD